MLDIITANDFVKAEIEEHGWDEIDAMFNKGYEPTLVNGAWCWKQASGVITLPSETSSSTLSSTKGQTTKTPLRV